MRVASIGGAGGASAEGGLGIAGDGVERELGVGEARAGVVVGGIAGVGEGGGDVVGGNRHGDG